MNEWRIITLGYKNIYLSSLLLKRLEIGCKYERQIQRQRRRTRIPTDGGLLYWPYSEPHLVLLLVFHGESLLLPRVVSWAAFALTWLRLMTDCPVCEYLYIYSSITPLHCGYPFGCQPTWPASPVLLITQQEYLVLEIPKWRVCKRSIC